MSWKEMSYSNFTQTSDEPEPEVWDEKYEPTKQEYTKWILEFNKNENLIGGE